MTILLVACALMPLITAVFLIRNMWVYRVRTDIVKASLDAYESLPSYDWMMWRFWRWDASWFIGRDADSKARGQREWNKAAKRGRAIIDRALEVGK